MQFITKILKITCKDTSPLISELMDHELSFSKRMRLKMHLAMCKACRFYREQLQGVSTMYQHLGKEDDPGPAHLKLKDASKEQIKQSLKNP